MSDIPDNAPAPRLCIIAKWPEFEGYGFNLHAEKSKPGQFIGKVDPGSPAEYAGLLEGDRIIEVNDVNIANENHKQVVQRIKMVQHETRLLVLDPKTDKYYKSKNIVVRGTQSNVIVKSSARNHKIIEEDEDDDDNAPALPSTPEPVSSSVPVTNGHHHHHHDDVDTRSVSSAASSSAASEASTQPQPVDAAADHEKDSAPEAAAMKNTEALRGRSPSPLPEEGDDNSSQEGDVKPTEEHVQPPDDDQPSENAYVKSLEEEDEIVVSSPLEDTSSHEGDVTPSDSEIAPEEVNVAETNKAVEVEAASEAAPSSPDPESDLEAEYDNVLLGSGKGGAEVDGGASPPAYTSRRSSASSSAGSHSPRGSDTAHTDTSTQSPMSTSPTPPPSLEPAPAPTPAPAATPTKPAPQPVSKNNAYNSSGLNLNMSAAEMRAKLARKKKTDPRNDSLDLRKKYEIIQNM